MIRNAIVRATIAVALFTLLAASAQAGSTGATARIGVVTDGPRARGFDIVEILKPEVREVCGDRYVIEFPEDAVLDGGWSPEGIGAALDAMLARPDIDLVMAVGVGAAAASCSRQELATPVVVPFAFAECVPACAQSSMLRVNTMGIGRLIARDLLAYREIVPFTRLAVLTEPAWIAGCDAAQVAKTVAPEGAEVRFVPVEPGKTDVVADLPAGTDAVYLMRLQQVDDAGFTRLVGTLTVAGIPTFSMIGEIEVEQGVLAGLNTTRTINSLARGAAVDVLDALDRRDADPPPLVDYGARLTVNLATARELDLGLSWEVLSDARMIEEDAYRSETPIDLETALRRAVDANLDVLVKDRDVAAGEENIREARSNYRPQLGVSVYGTGIDSDRAFPALGNYERYAAGSLTLTQLIYGDGASANITVQKDLQRARVSDRNSLRLDIARAAANAYLDLMRTEALVRIRQDDVDLNRANLDVARLRRSVGSAGSAEIYRWEAQLAAARAALLEAHSTRRLSERQLSRLLDYPVQTEWQTRTPGLEDGLQVLGGADEAPLLDNPSGYDRLNQQLLEQGLAVSPELAALDAAIDAQKRVHTAARRESYAPTVAFAAQLDQIVVKSEEGGVDLGPIGSMIPGVDDTLWNVGLRVSLPLYKGGAIKARRIRADEKLSGLRIGRRSVNERLSQRILSALDKAAASWPAITLRRQSADAAARTLELVQDSYGRGAASILDLLDAQNAALTAEFAAETAVYDFLKDWAEVQRSVADLGPDL